MKRRWLLAILVALTVALLLTACGSKRSAPMKLYTDISAEVYEKAAQAQFSNVALSDAASFDGADFGDARYIVVVTDDTEDLKREPIDGQVFTITIYDKGEGDMAFAMAYYVGTTERSVTKGNVIDGEMGLTDVRPIEATEVTDPAKRAKLVFKEISARLKAIEG